MMRKYEGRGYIAFGMREGIWKTTTTAYCTYHVQYIM